MIFVVVVFCFILNQCPAMIFVVVVVDVVDEKKKNNKNYFFSIF